VALILRYFTEFGNFWGALRKSVYVYDVVVKKFMFAISSPHEFLVFIYHPVRKVKSVFIENEFYYVGPRIVQRTTSASDL